MIEAYGVRKLFSFVPDSLIPFLRTWWNTCYFWPWSA